MATSNKTLTSAIKTMNKYLKRLSNTKQNMASRISDYSNQAVTAQQNADLFNAQQAEIQRNWSESMSATAHQREVADLKAAGLNPVISAYGSGASVGSGAAAQSSNMLTGVLGTLASDAMSAVSNLSSSLAANATSYANSMTAAETSKQNTQKQVDVQYFAAKLASKTNLSINNATNKINKYIAELNSVTSQQVAKIAGEYGVARQEVANIASEYSADLAYAASLYGSDRSAAVQELVTKMNNDNALTITNQNNATSMINSILSWFDIF